MLVPAYAPLPMALDDVREIHPHPAMATGTLTLGVMT